MCNEKFVHGHRCKNKRLCSLNIMEEDGEVTEEDGQGEEVNTREVMLV